MIIRQKDRKLKKSNRNIMFLLFDTRNKKVSLRFWVNRILADNSLQLSFENKISAQSFLNSSRVYEFMLPLLKDGSVDILVSELFEDKVLQKKLSSEYLAWRIEGNKND
jgi:hypothetical protein